MIRRRNLHMQIQLEGESINSIQQQQDSRSSQVPIQQKNLLMHMTWIQITNISILIALLGYSWVTLNNQSGMIKMGINLLTAGFTFSVIILIFLFNKKADSFNIILCFTVIFMILTIFLLLISGIIIATNITKPNTCPDYTNPVTLEVYGSFQTACVCINQQQYSYTVLGSNTLGYQCCDCPFSKQCPQNQSCNNGNPKTSIIGLIILGVSISHIYLMIWLFI